MKLNQFAQSYLCVVFLVLHTIAFSQDNYHTTLQNQLQSTYGLPQGEWIFHNTETSNLQSDYSWGSIISTDQNTSGQDFSRKIHLNISLIDGPQWNSGYGLKNVQPILQGDVCLFVIWLRAVDQQAKVSLNLQHAVNFTDEFSFTFSLDTSWQQFLIPFKASEDFTAGQFQLVLLLNWQNQVIETGGIALLNYENEIELSELPMQLNNDQYGGYEPNAPWRASAAERIEEIRKADLYIYVQNENDEPMPDVNVHVRLLDHQFGFGSAVATHLIAGNPEQNTSYQNHLLDLDGTGHRFNTVVLENSMKWQAWEQNWFGLDHQDVGNTVQWLADHHFQVRGHNLLWPGWSNMPGDMQTNQNNPTYLRDRILNHIESITIFPGIAGNISDWDVINESSVLEELANALKGTPGYITGREIYVDAFNKLLGIDPYAVTYVNDYTTFGRGSSAFFSNQVKQYTQEIVDAGVKLKGIGFQAHIDAAPTGIPELYDILDDYYTTFGIRAKITEFDMHPLINEDLAAKYLRDFYTMSFSHPSVDAILMWGFWDGAHWFNNAPLFRQDWSLKPSGQAFIDLVYHQWWTDTAATTNANGTALVRSFKGQVEYTIDCPGGSIVDTITFFQDTVFGLTCLNVSVQSTLEEELDVRFTLNPVVGVMNVVWNHHEPATLRLFDLQGHEVLTPVAGNGNVTLLLEIPPGMYELVVEVKKGRVVRKIIVD
ncbi:MAG TPA: endo-1,4-beta-xylanase [Saprospiraceae bacterium]|nr:endo-1,4-beta-xylanase [Saprospiraceae bacterium]